ncbi:glycosyltransferase family 2 protein [Exiguobacterium sp. s6]|uniref:glycosyltransferase family 2 protein n=1 Tax=Exiguobacterium sp. s6 TaxID=2751236 RepID=UPI001BEB89DF
MQNKVSIIVPTYKRPAKYLKRALDSLYNQTYPNIEIIVVDDNVPESLERNVIESFMNEENFDNRCIYVKNEINVGGALARNIGINLATGDYLTFLDDDDEYEPRKIEKQLAFMIDNGVDMSFTNLKIVNENRKFLEYRTFDIPKNYNKRDYLKYHLMYHLTGTPTFMYKTTQLKEIGGFEQVKMGQEFYLMLKTIESDLKIGYIDTCDVVAYRHNDGGISFGINKINGEKDLYNFKQKYRNLLTDEENSYVDFRHSVVMSIAYKRNQQYVQFVVNSLSSIIKYPRHFGVEVIKYLKRRSK